MSTRPLANLSASVHHRLLNKAQDAGRPFNEMLQYYAMERFLYRLSRSPAGDRFVLKGALMLMVWRAATMRSTMDIDLLGRTANDLESIREVMQAACNQAVEPDGMIFDPDSVTGERISEDAEYEGIRVHLRGNLGSARVNLQIDIGFGDVVSPEARVIEYPSLLDHPKPRMRGYSRESVIAEKLHAMIRHDLLNSRMKDFYDIWLLSRQFDFDGISLADAIRKTFARRDTDLVGRPIVAFTEAFYRDPAKTTLWLSFVRKFRLEPAPPSFEEVVLAVSTFLQPIIDTLVRERSPNIQWKAGGPWTS
ncbi:MAG: nucleotidyl transferase AbiEii/AbiGii toxin family protein [Kiritimatiellia bacterium]|nr:nucleotidyl transferase AbiEii/AbiGii toxin family protein [Kiritimatiellia bacterium]